MAARLLIYHMEEKRRGALEKICAALGIEPVIAAEDSYGAPVGLVSGTADIRKLAQTAPALAGRKTAAVDEEMIVMSGFTKKQFDDLLDTMNERQLKVELKAVETSVNRYWTGGMLQEELKKERLAARRTHRGRES